MLPVTFHRLHVFFNISALSRKFYNKNITFAIIWTQKQLSAKVIWNTYTDTNKAHAAAYLLQLAVGVKQTDNYFIYSTRCRLVYQKLLRNCWLWIHKLMLTLKSGAVISVFKRRDLLIVTANIEWYMSIHVT